MADDHMIEVGGDQTETEVTVGSETPVHRSWPFRILKWLAIAMLGILALALAIVFGLNTAPGKRLVANQISALEFESGMKIGVGRIEGSLYGAMVIHQLTVSDPKGVFLQSPRVAMDWRPFAFVSNHVDIRSLTAGKMTLQRLPEFKETNSDAPLLPDLDIDIGKLRIDQFIVEAPVSGERRVATLAGEAHIADGRVQVNASGGTLAGANRRGGDRFALKLDAVPEANRLGIDLDLRAPADGVIAAMAGLTDPLLVTISGKGDWTNWLGKANADLAGSPFARLELTARDGVFSVRGPTQVARLLEGQSAALLGPITTVDLTATPDERRIDVTGNIASDAFRLTTNGIVDLSDNSFDGMKLAFVLLKPSRLAENLRGSGLRGAATLDGAFATPLVDYSVNANRLVMNDMGLENLSAAGKARVDADQIAIPITARVARITGLDTVAGGTLTNVRLDGDLAIQGPRILSDNMRLRSDRIDAKLVLLADMSTGLYTGAVNGRIDNYRIQSVGIFDIITDVDLKTERQGYALSGRVGVRSRQLTNEGVRNFLGGNAVAGADIRYGGDGIARFSNLTLRAPLVRVTGGNGSYSPDGQIVFNADAVTQQYGPVGVRVAGTITDPRATITASRPNLGIGLANLEARITGARNGYRLAAAGDTDYGRLTADVVLSTGNALTLDINSANLGGIDFAGSLRQTAAGPFAGRLDANGNGFNGIVRLAAEGAYQQAIVNLRARDALMPGPAQLAIGSAIVDARVVLYDTPYIVADAQLAQTRLGALTLTAARAKVDYRGGRGSAQVLAEGVSGVPFRVAVNADLQPDLWRAAIKGRARGIDFATAGGPARIIPRQGAYELLPTRIDFGRGNVRLAGTYGQGIRLQSRLDAIDLSIIDAFVPGLGVNGKASGSLDFAQASSTAFPQADARLTVSNFTRTTSVSVSQAVDVNFVGKLLPSGGDARAVIRRRGAVIGRMTATLSPLSPGNGAWSTRLLEAPLGGGIRYNGPADTLFSLAGLADQRLSGPIGVAADFSCRVSAPCLNGIIRASNLTYENQTYGTRLSNMAIEGRFSGSQLEIRQLRATAGDGTIDASGTVGLAADSGYPMDVTVKMDNARLARSDSLSASANGQLRLTKAAGGDALLSGRIVLPETRYEVVRQGAAQVPSLTGVRFKPPKGPARITGDEPAPVQAGVFGKLRLDIDLAAPERLYVSGMGLESEWTADLNVGGTSAAPRMSGNVELVRGTLGFAGQSFELTEGRVTFTGGSTIDPTINMVATDDIDDVTVNVNVSGRAYNPQIAFSSSPGLPQDEIVSRILFGNSVGNLSAIQAVQLAASLNSLRGSGGGLNPLGKLRSVAGVDRLRILGPDAASGRGTALAAGQYITDDIYIELVTDARGFTATQLEVSLTPALSILSQAGGSGGTDVNVQYKKKY